MKNRIALMCAYVFGFLTVVSFVQAESSLPVLMKRSCQTVKFEAQKSESVEFASRKGRLEQVSKDKTAKAEKKMLKGADKPSASQDAASASDISNSFSMASEFIEAQKAYKLTITDSSGGSILISDDFLNQAPAEGYTSLAECLLELGNKAYEAKKYVYFKAKTGNEATPYQYSRLELDMTVGKAKLIMDMNAVTNPDGSGDLRYDKKAQQKHIAQRRQAIEKAMKSKTATDDQIEEMHELMMMQMQDQQAGHNRWDFDGNRRRTMQQKRQRQLEADGRIKPKKRSVKKDGEVVASQD